MWKLKAIRRSGKGTAGNAYLNNNNIVPTASILLRVNARNDDLARQCERRQTRRDKSAYAERPCEAE